MSLLLLQPTITSIFTCHYHVVYTFSCCVAVHLLTAFTLPRHVAAHLLTVTTLARRVAAHLLMVTTFSLCGCSFADSHYSLNVWLLTC